uniref:HAT C-terminal dimerisation domain-containing protein n=1 Tax=Amphimedon queenslandica TaxID=400682 RepID=A0A1X7VHV0_AMPQE
QWHQSNATIGSDSAEVYYRINVTIPLLDEVLESIKARVGRYQGEIATGILFVPAYMLTETASNILAVLPIATGEAERCISSLRLLATYLRNTMGNEHLTGLALMHIHQDVPVNITDIVDDFAMKH